LFYTSEINWIALLIAAIILVVLFGINRARVYEPLPYALLGIGLWLAFLESGIHPTIAGVLLAFTIPTRSPPNIGSLLAQCISVLDEFDSPVIKQRVTSNRYEVAAQTLETVADRMQSPAQRLEHSLLPWTTYLILPIFALANAGVPLQFDFNLLGPVSIGILFGLVIGKPLGITLLSWLVVKLGWAELPRNISMRNVFNSSWLAGIGFTMALFIANAAFDDLALLAEAKLAILVASLLAGVIGFVLSSFTSPTHEEHSQVDVVPATD
jgi:Na+:H+ antiporter, NhaA family